jgi:hypothetical protein
MRDPEIQRACSKNIYFWGLFLSLHCVDERIWLIFEPNNVIADEEMSREHTYRISIIISDGVLTYTSSFARV